MRDREEEEDAGRGRMGNQMGRRRYPPSFRAMSVWRVDAGSLPSSTVRFRNGRTGSCDNQWIWATGDGAPVAPLQQSFDRFPIFLE